MSLKTRLRLSIAALVAAVVLALSALSLYSVATARFEDVPDRATNAALQVQTLLAQRIGELMAEKPPAGSLEETEALWTQIVREDDELPRLLRDTLATSRIILEIDIVGKDGRILSSSDPASVGKIFEKLPNLAEWGQRSRWRQLIEVLTQRVSYDVSIPLGIQEPIFHVEVLVSSVLLRNTLMPQVRYLAILLSISLGAAMLLAIVASNIALLPLAKIGEAIDRIARGEFSRDSPAEKQQSEEYAAVQSKLNVLGQQFRGAREDVVQLKGNIDRLLERLEDVVLLFDRSDRLIVAGRAAENLLGRGRWELMGRTIDELFPPSTVLGAVVQGALQFRQSLKDHSMTLERQDKAPLRMLVSVELLEDFPSREHLGTLITLRDAETRQQIGSQLDISTRLAAISRLTGGVAHEIKNPLNAIALHLEVLKSEAGSQGTAVEREIEIISREIMRLDRVVKTFLDFNRPLELQLADLDLVALARDVSSLIQPEARKHKVEVVLEANREPVPMRGDLDLLKQAVLNVVANGVESMTKGGQVTIRVERIGDECVFSVSDQGAGIPPEIREKIFNLYFTTKGTGSGIGLAMTFRIVQLHNGTIDFASESGKGTTFWLRFPGIGKEPLTSTPNSVQTKSK